MTETAFYYHLDISAPGRAESQINWSLDSILEQVLIPLQLKRAARVNGYEFHPNEVRRLRVRRTPEPMPGPELLSDADFSSFGAAFSSLMGAAARLPEGEDVTDDLLIRARQAISERGLESDVQASVFGDMDPARVFIAMSFSDLLQKNVDAIKDAAKKFELQANRVDEEISSDGIAERIQQHLAESTFVVADLTDARPNVYYEIGFFDALLRARGLRSDRHLLLVARDLDEVHFDLKHRGIQLYDDAYDLMKIVERWFDGLLRTGKSR